MGQSQRLILSSGKQKGSKPVTLSKRKGVGREWQKAKEQIAIFEIKGHLEFPGVFLCFLIGLLESETYPTGKFPPEKYCFLKGSSLTHSFLWFLFISFFLSAPSSLSPPFNIIATCLGHFLAVFSLLMTNRSLVETVTQGYHSISSSRMESPLTLEKVGKAWFWISAKSVSWWPLCNLSEP